MKYKQKFQKKDQLAAGSLASTMLSDYMNGLKNVLNGLDQPKTLTDAVNAAFNLKLDVSKLRRGKK